MRWRPSGISSQRNKRLTATRRWACFAAASSNRAISSTAARRVRIWNRRCTAVCNTSPSSRHRRSVCSRHRYPRHIVRALAPLPDLPHPALIRTLTGGNVGIWGCAMSPDESFIVSAADDGVLIVWDADTATERLRLTGHTAPIRRCAISSDGSFIVSAAYDRRVRIWDAATGAVRHVLLGHTDGVTDCAVSADGSFIVTSSLDESVRIWDTADLDSPANIVRAVAGRARRLAGAAHAGRPHGGGVGVRCQPGRTFHRLGLLGSNRENLGRCDRRGTWHALRPHGGGQRLRIQPGRRLDCVGRRGSYRADLGSREWRRAARDRRSCVM